MSSNLRAWSYLLFPLLLLLVIIRGQMGMSKPVKKNIVCWVFFGEESSGFFLKSGLRILMSIIGCFICSKLWHCKFESFCLLVICRIDWLVNLMLRFFFSFIYIYISKYLMVTVFYAYFIENGLSNAFQEYGFYCRKSFLLYNKKIVLT